MAEDRSEGPEGGLVFWNRFLQQKKFKIHAIKNPLAAITY